MIKDVFSSVIGGQLDMMEQLGEEEQQMLANPNLKPWQKLQKQAQLLHQREVAADIAKALAEAQKKTMESLLQSFSK